MALCTALRRELPFPALTTMMKPDLAQPTNPNRAPEAPAQSDLANAKPSARGAHPTRSGARPDMGNANKFSLKTLVQCWTYRWLVGHAARGSLPACRRL
eukprot:1243430-Prymnesium_polylepis.1